LDEVFISINGIDQAEFIKKDDGSLFACVLLVFW
jgi:hypothetical protein